MLSFVVAIYEQLQQISLKDATIPQGKTHCNDCESTTPHYN